MARARNRTLELIDEAANNKSITNETELDRIVRYAGERDLNRSGFNLENATRLAANP